MDIQLQEKKILNDNQWGFRKSKSTEGLLLSLKEKWKQELDEGKVVGALFGEFIKAFNSVDRGILKKTLLACRFRSDIYDWFEITWPTKDSLQMSMEQNETSKLLFMVCHIARCQAHGYFPYM